jgi:hypothetical protein
MPTALSKDHRKILEKTTAEARQLAESACKAALENLAVHEKEAMLAEKEQDYCAQYRFLSTKGIAE